MIWAGCSKPNDDPSRRSTPAERREQPESSAAAVDLVTAAQRAISSGDLSAAESAIRSHLIAEPQDAGALELAGDIAAMRGDAETSCRMYRAAADIDATPSLRLLDKLVQEQMRSARPFDAIVTLQEVIDRYPSHPQARYDLAGMATMIGMPAAATPALQWLASHGGGDPESLLVLADPERVEPDADVCRKMLQRNPNDLRPQYSLARLDATKLDWESVIKRLEPVLRQHKEFVPAFALYGRGLIERGEYEKIPAWQLDCPPGVDASADYWLVAGAWGQYQGRHEEAARAFWEALRVDEIGHPEALTRLMLSLKEIGRERDAEIVARQISKYSTLRDALKTHLERSSRSQRAAMGVAEAMMNLGRIWEGEGWARLAATLPDERLADFRDRYLAIRSQLTTETPWQLPDMTLASRIDLSGLPLVDWVPKGATGSTADQWAAGRFLFEDQAQQRGWIHTCEIAPEADTEGHWIFQSVGGGVGVIDFDLDGWPDLAAAMLDGKPLQSNSSPNRLFRNLGGKFVEWSERANYMDTGFSQGIAVGDFNDDGFPDVFDANIGRNRLYRNNGDGTFQDVSAQAGLSDELWTTSALIADIDADGAADLFEVNYCRGPEPYHRACRNSEGIATCPPLTFDAEDDRLKRGRGDGTWVDVSEQWMDQTTPGRGLGVIVGMLDERPGLDVYVANDMTVNHLWSGGSDDGGFRMTDLGVIRGVGLSGRSLSQASMGIAAADPDGDGDIDFFLTHFSDDHNTYYEQVAPGLWTDRSYPVGLAEPSMKLLGFGTAWVDFDNNGTLELIVANGHVDDVSRSDISYLMPPQLFHRGPSGRWQELDRNDLGDYFATDHLGRALATVDADRDGRTDVAITHLGAPVSLLINRTQASGHSLTLELKSTRGQRDAIGATVTARVGERTITLQLTAGDGYMCSNQRRLTLGLGEHAEARDVVVTWPDATVQSLGTLEGDRDYLVVEGAGEPFPLPAVH